MRYYAKLTFYLNNDYSFSNLGEDPIQLFEDGDALCVAWKDERWIRRRIVIEYGPFLEREKAEQKGINLVRCIKLDMIKREYPIQISEERCGLDSPRIISVFGGVSEWAKLCETYADLKSSPKIIENECIGLGIYEVEENLDEIEFFIAEGEGRLSQNLALNKRTLKFWNEHMDISLSLLVSSVGINDIRATFLLRMMAMEALVSENQTREEEYISAIDQLYIKIDEMETCDKYKKRLKEQLGRMKQKSIKQKVCELLKMQLGGKKYAGYTAEELFAQCYKARNGFVHAGKWGDIDGETVRELKIMCMDLLYSISETATAGEQ